jgi:hypothetical protein
MTVALTAGGVPTPADLDTLTTVYVAGQKLRASDLAEVGVGNTPDIVFVAGDKVRMSQWGDLGA